MARNTKLLENQTANIADPTPVEADGARKTLVVWGTFDSGTITIQGSPDGGTTWITLQVDGSPATYTSDAVAVIDFLGLGLLIRATLAGATTPNVSAQLY